MHKNIGLLKEDEMILLFNNKKIKELSNNGKHFIKEMFGLINEEEVIKSSKINDYVKPDFSVECNGITHYVSMKSGRCDTVHQEYVKDFCKFLQTQGISVKTLQTILLYHYGDGTLDGTGSSRMSYEKLRYLLKERIKLANEELNSNKDFVWNIINRTVFKGTKAENLEADYIYHGNADYGVLASKKQIYKHFLRRDWKWMDSLHIGPLMIYPHARYIGKEIKRPKSRERLEFDWVNFREDIEYISTRYDG